MRVSVYGVVVPNATSVAAAGPVAKRTIRTLCHTTPIPASASPPPCAVCWTAWPAPGIPQWTR